MFRVATINIFWSIRQFLWIQYYILRWQINIQLQKSQLTEYILPAFFRAKSVHK